MRQSAWMILSALLFLVACTQGAGANPDVPNATGKSVARIVYFRAEDCEPCAQVEAELIMPLAGRCGEQLELKTVDVAETAGYEAFVAAEEAMIGEAGRWQVPIVLLEDTYLIGQRAIEQELLPELECIYGAGGNTWPDVPALAQISVDATPTVSGEALDNLDDGASEICVDEEVVAVCASPNPIFALYLREAECNDTCERTHYDLRYLQGVYPQLFFEERVIDEDPALFRALANELGVELEGGALAPAVVVGEHYLTGEALTLDSLHATLETYAETGVKAIWYTLDED